MMQIPLDMKTTKSSAAKTVTVTNVRSKDVTRFGVKHEGEAAVGHNLEIVVGVSVRLFGTENNRYVKDASGRMVPGSFEYSRTFKVGDAAEYDSFNLSYVGTITAITEKTITICESNFCKCGCSLGSCSRGCTTGKAHRLDLSEFSRRNKHFDAQETAERNHETSMCL